MAKQATLPPLPSELAFTRPSPLKRSAALVRQNPLGAFGLLVITVLLIAGVFSPLLAPHEIDELVGKKGLGPSRDFPFGTDKFGQDIFSRMIYGARISLQ